MKLDNVNILGSEPIRTPDEVKKDLPLSRELNDAVSEARESIQNILLHKDSRHLLIAGPCSIHNTESAMEYALKLNEISQEVSEKILIVMRVYFEKPRTTVGWKGFIYDPGLDGSDRINDGLASARRLLIDINTLGLPAATEFLDPIVPQYIADLVSWAAIGARTTESQTHRQMASGLSMPVGFKNATDGSIGVAVNAVKAASTGHSFLGVTGEGRSAVFRTSGNPFGHLVLRGGEKGPNYGSEYIAFSKESMRKAGIKTGIIVDCSHDNSGKDPSKQPAVMRNVISQISGGDCPIAGTMLESHLETGNQSFAEADPKRTGLSVTDSCLGWKETETLIREMNENLGTS